MRELEAELASFYDQQASYRAGMRADPRREALRTSFVELLRAEGRDTVFEVGTGPGRDALPMLADGLSFVGIDLSQENVRRCTELGIDCRHASLFDIPFPDHTFPAGWTMSTLLHVPDARIDDALREIIRVLERGAPLAIGVWGGPDSQEHRQHPGIDTPRFFSSRNDNRWREILERHGTLELFDTWPDRRGDMRYQYCVLRTPEA